MTRKKIFVMLAALLGGFPLMAAETESTFASMMEGPNLALAVIALIQLIAILSVGGIIKKLTRNTDYFVKLKKLRDESGTKIFLALAATVGFSTMATAQEAEAARPEPPTYPDFFADQNTLLLLGLNVLLLLVFVYMTRLLKNTVAMLMPEIKEAPQVEAEPAADSGKVIHALTDAVPVEREHEVMMDHEYDGIRELDNNLPPWWVWMFYATIFFAFVYMIYYHVLPYGKSQEEQYIAEVQQAEEAREAYLAMAKNLVDENNVEFLTAEADLKSGKAIFVENCQQCHAPDGGGGVGPNLTDDYWIHGPTVKDIFKTVKYGVPTKGMISWESQLRPNQMAQVASYVKSLQGTEPLNPKEPQGELMVAPEESAAPADTTDVEPDVIESEEEEAEETNQTASLK